MPDRSFFEKNAVELAPALLGKEMCYGGRRGIIVETEAYREDDPASHSYRGRSPRNEAMYLSGGHVYVYRIYGIHRCLNIVAGREGSGEAVLLRACEPLAGIREMWQDRYGEEPPEDYRSDRRYLNLTNGPGKLCQAFGIELEKLNGSRLGEGGLVIQSLDLPSRSENPRIAQSSRIGLTSGKGDETPWRWFYEHSPFVGR